MKYILLIIMMLVCGNAYSATQWCDDTGAVACYPFDGTEANSLLDQSGDGNNLTNLNVAFTSSGCYDNECYDFAINNNKLYTASTPSFTGNTEGTIVTAFNRSTAGITANIAYIGDSGTNNNLIRLSLLSSNSIQFLVKAGSVSDIVATYAVGTEIDTWKHVAVTMSSSGSVFYIDGSEETLTYTTGSASSDFWLDDCVNVDRLAVGFDDIASGAEFRGLIDDVAWFSTPLSSTDINDIFNNGLVQTAVATGTLIKFYN